MATYPAAGTLVGKTTLAAAITSANQTAVNLTTLSITVGSLTTVTARNPQWGIMVDGEIMELTSLGASTTVYVTRGACGTAAVPHGNGATVWAAPLEYLPAINPVLTSAPQAKLNYQTVPIGSVAYASAGTDTTLVAGTLYYAGVEVRQGFVATGIATMNGGTATTDKGIAALYDAAGNLVASSATAGALVATANIFQSRAFSPGTIYVPAGPYFIAYQQNGTTATLRTIAVSTFVDTVTSSKTGTFGTLPASLTVPTTVTADVGPYAYIY